MRNKFINELIQSNIDLTRYSSKRILIEGVGNTNGYDEFLIKSTFKVYSCERYSVIDNYLFKIKKLKVVSVLGLCSNHTVTCFNIIAVFTLYKGE